jgi:hypothetical protein
MVVVALIIGAVGTALPLPTFRNETAMATETRRPLSEGATVRQAPEQPPVTDEGPETPAPPDGTATTTTAVSPTTASPTTAPTTPPTTAAEPEAPAPAARVVVGEDTRDFDLIGVTLPATPTTPVLVRTADDAGVWGDWHELHFEDVTPAAAVPGADVPPEPDEGKPGAHSEPFWVGEASRYELDLAADDAEAADVHLVYETTRRVVVETQEAGADPGAPAIYGRDHWGARAPNATPTIAPALNTAIIHHTAGANVYSPGDVPGILRGIQAYHMDANGWDDIAYNFLVDYWGRIWEGRAGGVTATVVGAHTRGFNTGSVGVAVLGNFDEAYVSSPALEAIVQITGWKFAINDVDPRQNTYVQAGAGSPVYAPGTWLATPRIFTHRDVGQTSCPGGWLYYWLDAVRNAVNERAPWMAPPGAVVGGNFVGGPEMDVFLRQPGVLSDSLNAGSANGFYGVRYYNVDGSFAGVVGDYDGNGYDDIYWYAPGPGTDWIWLSDGNDFWQYVSASNSSFQAALVGDYDGDGDDDIYWYAPGPAEDYLWAAQAGQFYGLSAPQVSSEHSPVAGDFTGDGKDEILWSGNPSWLWETFGAGITFYGRAAAPAIGSYWARSGDFDNDGDDDIMWYAPGPASDWMWTAQRGSFAGYPAPSVDAYFTSLVAGDVDGNGGEDLLWYASPGTDWVWRYAGGRMFGAQAQSNLQFR